MYKVFCIKRKKNPKTWKSNIKITKSKVVLFVSPLPFEFTLPFVIYRLTFSPVTPNSILRGFSVIFPTSLEGGIFHKGLLFFSYNENVVLVNVVQMSLLVCVAWWHKATEAKLSKWSAEALQSSKISIKLNKKAWGSACELLYKLWMTEPSRHITHTRKLGGW